MTESQLRTRRFFLHFALFSPLILLGCGNSQDDTHVQIGDKTKAEAKARAELYRAKAKSKKPGARKR